MDQDTLDSLSNAVSEDAWEHRKAFVGFGAADEAILRELRPVALQYADEVMDELYGRWLQFPELKRFFPEAATLSRVKALQRQYFVSLTGGEYDAAYLAHRLRVGAVHKKIGLTPEWVMGAFSIYLELILPRVLRAFEYDRVKQHAVIGADLLAEVAVPGPLASLVRHHHENWDGSGYPDGRSSDDIPVGARVLAIADCYDALTSNRPYRRALSHDSAVAMIHERRGSMFDPEMTDAFLQVVWQLRPVSPAIYRPAKAIRPRATRALVLVGAASR